MGTTSDVKAMVPMSLRAYGKHRKSLGLDGGSHKAVQKAIEAGRITPTGGKIDPVQADAEWERNTAPRPNAKPPHRRIPSPTMHRQPSTPDGAPGGASYATARAVKEHFLAKLVKLQHDERVGALISRDAAYVERFNTARIVRDAVLNIADRVAAQLAAESDEKKVHEILSTELRNALHAIADNISA